ncbi:MAG: FAD-binding oxidoreductase [Acidimicrobiia bacterium]|nr:FAD-binding oxidoreductase [Acidimicrobiia bacterium]
MKDLVIVGGGVMGAPAAFHAAAAGADVTVIASPEPVDMAGHDGPFGAHYDQSRLVWRVHADPVGTVLADRSIRQLAALERHSDAVITRPSPMLFATGPGLSDDQLAAARSVAYATYGLEFVNTDAMRTRWSSVSFAEDVEGYIEPPPAGLLDPRAMVDAFLMGSGAEIVPGVAIAVDLAGNGCRVTTSSGGTIDALRVLVAAGAFSNRNGLLPRPLALRFKTESVVFAEIDETQAQRFLDVPPMHYNGAPTAVAEIYTAPPLRTADGRWRLKLGANTVRDRWLSGADESIAWYRSAGLNNPLPLLRRAMLQLYRGLDSTVWRTERCVITYTAHGHPYIDELVPGRLYVATGGNGRSAKWGPELGRLAAALALSGRWEDDVPHAWFAAHYEDHPVWQGPELLRDRS